MTCLLYSDDISFGWWIDPNLSRYSLIILLSSELNLRPASVWFMNESFRPVLWTGSTDDKKMKNESFMNWHRYFSHYLTWTSYTKLLYDLDIVWITFMVLYGVCFIYWLHFYIREVDSPIHCHYIDYLTEFIMLVNLSIKFIYLFLVSTVWKIVSAMK